MTLKSILKPQESILSGIAVAGLVAAAYSFSLPNAATVQATDAYDKNVESGRRKAAFMSVGVVSAISLLTRDMNVFILGGAVTIAFDWHVRHAISVHPATGQVVTQSPKTRTLSVAS